MSNENDLKSYRSKLLLIAFMTFAALQFLSQQSNAMESVSFALQWNHQSQFAGYYVALDKGFYKDVGLDVTLVKGGSDVDPLKLLNEGKVDFCSTMLANALYMEHENKDSLVLLAQIINRSNLALVAWKDGKNGQSKILKPADLAGKTVTIWENFLVPYKSFFHKENVSPKIVPQYYKFSLFLHHGADACCVMIYNEYHLLRQASIDPQKLTVFMLWNYGVNIPEDGIYCKPQTLNERPETCKKFAEASMRGWKYARENPKYALDVVMRYVESSNLPTNRPHMKWMLQEILSSIYPSDKGSWQLGRLSRKAYEQTLKTIDIAPNKIPYKKFVTEGAQDVQN